MRTFILILISSAIWIGAAAAAEEGQKINVTMTEYHFNMPATAKAGKTTFVVKNAGQKEHAFKIKGEGMEQRLSPDPKPGQTGTLQVDLKPGTYEITCPLPFHTMHGMKTTLTVK
ncbi:MAG TPA: cupredoxin domain-containing protein [Chthoniobacterales bacterium]|nr:cupredoxin domain-containing protein [Chthoniobacterales bacterium]